MAKNLTIGENYISEVDLIDSDGNSINRDDIEDLTVQIRQYNRVIASYTFGVDDQLTDGTTATKLKIETSEELSLKFREGRVYARVRSGDENVLYTQDGGRISLPDYHILTMYSQIPADDETVTEQIEHYRGFYDASSGVAPSTGGAGTGGAILAADYYVTNVAGTVFGIYCPVGTRFTALVNNPGQTSGNWQLQGSLG